LRRVALLKLDPISVEGGYDLNTPSVNKHRKQAG